MIHGQSRVRRQEISVEEAKRQEDQAEQILNQTSYFFKIRQLKVPQPEDPLAYCELLAKLCPEIATIYNYRRELLLEMISQNIEKIQSEQDQEQQQITANLLITSINKELDWLTSILKRHPKSYTLWSYREWLVIESIKIDKILCQKGIQTLIQAVTKEFGLCAKMLQMDERNFHVWNYRNWLVNISGQGNVEAFTSEKIKHNFSNFSAYHFRSKYFLSYYNNIEKIRERIGQNQTCPLSPVPLDIVIKELELIKEAIYIQPKEQGVYLYHKWLLGIIQPYGVISIQRVINHELQDQSCSIFTIILNKRVKNLNLLGCIQIKADGIQQQCDQDYTINTSNNKEQDHFYTIKFLKNCDELEVVFNNNILINENSEFSQQEQLISSRYFIPVTYKIGQGSTTSSLNENTQQELQKIVQLLDDNIAFIQNVLDEEQNLKYALLQKAALLAFKLEIQILLSNIPQEVLETAKQVCQTYQQIIVQGPSVMANIKKYTEILELLEGSQSIEDGQDEYWKHFERQIIV